MAKIKNKKTRVSKRQLNFFPSTGILVGGALLLALGLGVWLFLPKAHQAPVVVSSTTGAEDTAAASQESSLPEADEEAAAGLYGAAAKSQDLEEEKETPVQEYPAGGMDEPLDTPGQAESLVVSSPPEAGGSAPTDEVDPEAALPQVALIIDDMGNRLKLGTTLIDMDLNLNFAILPHSPYGLKLAEQAHERGRDVLLHLPMEASDKKWNPGPGALYLAMSDDTIKKTVSEDLEQVPMAIGISNHMGSIFSENRQAMEVVLGELKSRNLFFVDSLTSSKSLGAVIARELGVKSAKRNIFLDNVQEEEKIIEQLEKLIRISEIEGSAIGLGHPYPATLKALQSMSATLKQKITLVPIHQLVN